MHPANASVRPSLPVGFAQEHAAGVRRDLATPEIGNHLAPETTLENQLPSTTLRHAEVLSS